MAPPENDTPSPAHSQGSQRALWRGADQSSVMGAELIAAILLWAGIGWLVDSWLGTMPWFMAGGALIGNAAGLYLIWLRSSREEHSWQKSASVRSAAMEATDAKNSAGEGGKHDGSR